MKLRVITELLLLALMVLSLVCVIPVTPASDQTTPIKVGIFAPYPSASALSLYGAWTVQGFQLGLIYATGGTNKTTAGRSYELHYYDTKTDAAGITTLATNAIENDKIDILVGGTSSAVAAGLQAVAAQYHKLYFITPGADSSLTGSNFNKYSFRLARNSYQDAITGIKYAWDTIGARNYAILAPSYSFGVSGAKAMEEEITARGGTVVDTVYAPLATTDFSPFMNTLIADDTAVGNIDMLMVIWAGGGFSYLYNDLATYNITKYMNVSSGVIDTASMDFFARASGSLVNQTGLAVYGYKLANNSVNTWMVNESIKRNLSPDSGTPGSAGSIYGMDLSDIHVPELFTPDGFSTAEFLVNVTNNVKDLNVDNMICNLEGMTLATPKGMEKLRAEDHQGLPEMYIAKIINDTDSTSPTYNHMIGKLVQTLSGEEVAPPITADYKTCAQQAAASKSTSQEPSVTSTVTPGFSTPLVLFSMVIAAAIVVRRKDKNI